MPDRTTVGLFNRFDIYLKPATPVRGSQPEKIGEGCLFTNGVICYVTRKTGPFMSTGSIESGAAGAEIVKKRVSADGQLVPPGNTVEVRWLDGDPPSDDPWA